MYAPPKPFLALSHFTSTCSRNGINLPSTRLLKPKRTGRCTTYQERSETTGSTSSPRFVGPLYSLPPAHQKSMKSRYCGGRLYSRDNSNTPKETNQKLNLTENMFFRCVPLNFVLTKPKRWATNSCCVRCAGFARSRSTRRPWATASDAGFHPKILRVR